MEDEQRLVAVAVPPVAQPARPVLEVDPAVLDRRRAPSSCRLLTPSPDPAGDLPVQLDRTHDARRAPVEDEQDQQRAGHLRQARHGDVLLHPAHDLVDVVMTIAPVTAPLTEASPPTGRSREG